MENNETPQLENLAAEIISAESANKGQLALALASIAVGYAKVASEMDDFGFRASRSKKLLKESETITTLLKAEFEKECNPPATNETANS